MQTLTSTLFPCYAAADREIAVRIAAFLERGADVRIFMEEGELQPGEGLVSKAREGRMADAVLVLFSRLSMPPRWPRAEWEPALVQEPKDEAVRIGFVRCDDCVPPRVLAPLFDLSGLAIETLRQLKRWVRQREVTFEPPVELPCEGHETELGVLGIAIADRPGTETALNAAVAFEFARQYGEDFDEILQLECGERTLTAVAGDLGAQLGLRLEGPLEENLERLREFCSARRFLLLLTGVSEAAAGALTFGGRTSTLIVRENAPPATRDPLWEIQRAFRHIEAEADWTALCVAARSGRRLLTEGHRTAERYELMEQWYREAETRGDGRAQDESAREMAWILDAWGREDEARVLRRGQLARIGEQATFRF